MGSDSSPTDEELGQGSMACPLADNFVQDSNNQRNLSLSIKIVFYLGVILGKTLAQVPISWLLDKILIIAYQNLTCFWLLFINCLNSRESSHSLDKYFTFFFFFFPQNCSYRNICYTCKNWQELRWQTAKNGLGCCSARWQ